MQRDLRIVLGKAPDDRRQYHDLALYFLELALKRLRCRTQQWEDVSLLSAGARICKWLVELASSKGALHDSSILEVSDSERIIGQSLGGISRESVSRILVALAAAGVIARKGKSLRILNASRLQLLASGAEPLPVSVTKRRKNGQVVGFLGREFIRPKEECLRTQLAMWIIGTAGPFVSIGERRWINEGPVVHELDWHSRHCRSRSELRSRGYCN